MFLNSTFESSTFPHQAFFKHDLFSCKGESMRLANSENETAPVYTNFTDY